MKCLLLLLVVAACHRDAAPPPIKLDSAVVRPADAAPVVIDAPPIAVKPTAVKVVVGARASCAVMSDASARCWGANEAGELGDGTTVDSSTPVKPKLRGVQELALGDAHACALLDDTSVACWGSFGKAGKTTLEPTAVAGVRNAQHVFALGGASCASIAGGAFVCWGDIDARGHIGAGGAHRVPTAVVGLDHVAALTARAALRDDGDVAMWTGERARVTDIVELASRDDVTCGRTSAGVVSCFGANQPCAAPPKPAPAAKPKAKAKKPVKPPKPAPPAFAVANLALPAARHLAFDAGLCVVTTAGKLECLSSCKPEARALAKVDTVAGSCARITDGTVRCWTADKPIAIAGVTGATQLAANGARACSVLAEHQVVCWDGTHAAVPIAF